MPRPQFSSQSMDFIDQCGYDEGWVYHSNYLQAAVWLHTPRLSKDPTLARLEDEMFDYWQETPAV